MNVGEAIIGFNRFDLLFLFSSSGCSCSDSSRGRSAACSGWARMLFSFLLAANLRGIIGPFLAENWNQFPDEYAVMLGFLIVFIARPWPSR